jgi:hypothetical protein
VSPPPSHRNDKCDVVAADLDPTRSAAGAPAERPLMAASSGAAPAVKLDCCRVPKPPLHGFDDRLVDRAHAPRRCGGGLTGGRCHTVGRLSEWEIASYPRCPMLTGKQPSVMPRRLSQFAAAPAPASRGFFLYA